MKRKLSPYELNHLRRAGINPDEINDEAPVEQISGSTDFYGLKFEVTPDVLIPRLETEELIVMALSNLPSKPVVNIADIGTGSGVVAICLANELLKKRRKFSIIGSDISSKALAVAKKNSENLLSSKELSAQGSKLEWLQSDLFSNFPEQRFDLIAANLPYIPSGRIAHLDSSVRDYEPRIALDGGEDGLRLIDSLLSKAPRFLSEDGLIILEVDYTHTKKVFIPYSQQWNITYIKDTFNRQRFAMLKMA